MGMISTDELTVSAAEPSISDDIDKSSPNDAKISAAQGSFRLLLLPGSDPRSSDKPAQALPVSLASIGRVGGRA
jgi:hypothetical protein